ncbi:hypothetical protein [Mycoplasmopsis gallinacea]|uniref:Uncharacterized protein n=1 Tax=Mycoplasmopsis gallinacea TaxID=29556 RepID=A0A6H0V3M8_9BACT|nr:hypothetical protein [Mycoplasmopsis gallinacea]QIW62334.1 hypothetical protein GOQ20_02780 [Mycoplasmopsis gallinacea]
MSSKELLNKIELGRWNPRFGVINKMNFDFISKLKYANEYYNIEYEIKEIAKLYCENIISFTELFNSISVKWFPTNEFIEVIKKDENKFIVVEGNRRIAVLKIIANREKYLINMEDAMRYSSEEEYAKIKKLREFIQSISVKKINSFELKEEQIKIHNDNIEISNSLFKKNGIGGIGYQKWNTLLLYLDIYYIFVNNEIYEEYDLQIKKEIILTRLNMDAKTAWEHYKKACWLIQICKNNFLENQLENFDENFLKLNENALSRNSLIKVFKEIAIKARKDFDYKSNINIKFDKAKREFVNSLSYKEYSIDKLQNFIYDVYYNRLYGINISKEETFFSIFKEHKFKMETKEFLRNFWNFSFETLVEMEENVKNENVKSLLSRRKAEFKIASKISNYIKVKFKKFKSVDILLKQIIHNTQISSKKNLSKFFLNATVAAIRAISEYFIKLALLQTILNNNTNIAPKETQDSLNQIFEICLPRKLREKTGKYIHHFPIENENDKKILYLSFHNICLDNSDINNRNKLGIKFENKMSEQQKVLFYNVPNETVFSSLLNTEIYKKELQKLFKSYDTCEKFINFYKTSRSLLSYFIHNVYSLEFAFQINMIEEKIIQSLKQFNDFFDIIDHINYVYIERVMEKMNIFPDKDEEPEYIE